MADPTSVWLAEGESMQPLAEAAMASVDCEIKFQRLFQSLQQGAFFSTLEGRFIDFNDALQSMLGYERREDLLAIDLARDLYADSRDRLAMMDEVAEQGFVKDHEVRFRRRDGSELSVLLTAHPLIDRRGRTVGYQGLIQDVTRQRQMQQQLLQSEKLATIGSLAAGVAHELNNPLGGIVVYAHLLLEQLAEDDPRRRHATRIVHEATRCTGIIRELLQFCRRSEPSLGPTSVAGALRTVVELLGGQAMFHDIDIRFDVPPALPEVRADPSHLEQVFANIVLNAAEAMEGKGTVSVSAELCATTRSVAVTIEDDGPGMTEEVRARIFEPFFTTKCSAQAGSGTGLGLAISHGLLVGQGGSIDVWSEPGRGTRFTIRLPVASPEPEGGP